ncbi:hypothetical protein JKP88DRAFT_289334 [Tribonema minus]|uniref:K Homology domain-containing protein n=1 Tax=Tribonema minus TaxID=303371 RepID=A0A836CIW2_9STRA|nr:hypothetical protein JKP88DRAFT_289334 [Tribonema minus]
MASAGAAPGIGVGQHQANASSEVATTAGGGLHEDVDSSLRADKGVPPCALKLLVSNNMAGSLIGKAGQTIQNVQLQSGAVVKVSTSGMYLPGTQDRVVLVTGDLPRVKAACALVLHTVHEQGRDRDCGVPAPLDIGTERDALEVTQRLLIPASAGGLVIGRGGSNIKGLSESSGARVSLSQKQTSPSSERVVTIGGSLGACRLCIDMLLDTLKREPAAAVYTNLSVNYAHPPAGAAAAAGAAPSSTATGSAEATGISVDRHARQPLPPLPTYPPEMLDLIQPLNMPAPTHPVAAAVAGAAAVTTITVSIPDNMSTSGARINVSQRGDFIPGTSNRTVTITGSPAAAQAAQFLITHRIQAAASEAMQRQQQQQGGGR